MTMQETRLVFPEGCKFQPSDQQLLEYYLYNRIRGNPDPFDYCFVREVDLYGSKEPLEIWEQFGGPNLEDGVHLYFFTHLKKKNANGSRNDRRVGSGVWQGEDGGKVVKSKRTKQKIGIKKRYRYENDKSLQHGCWIMHEYLLNPSLLPQELQSCDYVVCRIKRKKKSKKKRKLDEQVSDIDLPEPVVENQPLPLIGKPPYEQHQPFKNHSLMQQTQEESHQLSMIEQNSEQGHCDPLEQFVKIHQSLSNFEEYQQLLATENCPYDQLEKSVQSHQLSQFFEIHQLALHNPPNFQKYQQLPTTELCVYSQHEKSVQNHQPEQFVDIHQSTLHNPPNFEEYQQLPTTECCPYDQLEKSVQNHQPEQLVDIHQAMLHNPPNFEEYQQLSTTESCPYDQLEKSLQNHQPEQFVDIHESMLHNPPNFEEYQQLSTTESCPYDQLEKPVQSYQQMLQSPFDIMEHQQLSSFDDNVQWLQEYSADNDFLDLDDIFI